MRRREFLAGGLLLANQRLAVAQDSLKIPRVGYISHNLTRAGEPYLRTFRSTLRDLGYVEGKHIQLDVRFADGLPERVPILAAELVELRPALIVAVNTPAARAMKGLTSTIPIVMVAVGNPIGLGLIDSLSRPGRNFTGVSDNSIEQTPKHMQLLKELVPTATKIAILYNPSNPQNAEYVRHATDAATELRVSILPVAVQTPEAVSAALSDAVQRGANCFFVANDSVTARQREMIIEFMNAHRLPAMYTHRDPVAQGGLLSYSPDFFTHFARAAAYVDGIIKGANPADLPVEQPTDYRLILNMKTATTLGLTIPPTLLARADEVIE
jgi:putative ABC transport system substrate-binding protein